MSLLWIPIVSLILFLHPLTCTAQPLPLTGQNTNETVETATGLACADFGQCNSCLSAASPWSCCWCPTDGRCHTFSGIFYSRCKGCMLKANASMCPAAPAKRTAFRPDVAERMAVFSRSTYWSDPRQQKGFPSSFEMTMNVTYSIGPWNSAFLYLGVDMSLREIVLAFRGSNTLTQLADELIHSNLRNGFGVPGALVNDYFLTAIENLQKNITLALKTVQSRCPDCRLMATGHSLGGAMAALSSFLLSEESPDLKEKISLYTFGQPRVGNAITAARLDAALPIFFRVVNGMDIVAHLPFCTHNSSAPPAARELCVEHPNGYYHAGTEIWFPKGDYKNGVMCEYKECLGLPAHEDNSCSDGALTDALPSEPDHQRYWDVIPQGYCNSPTSTVDPIVV